MTQHHTPQRFVAFAAKIKHLIISIGKTTYLTIRGTAVRKQRISTRFSSLLPAFHTLITNQSIKLKKQLHSYRAFWSYTALNITSPSLAVCTVAFIHKNKPSIKQSHVWIGIVLAWSLLITSPVQFADATANAASEPNYPLSHYRIETFLGELDTTDAPTLGPDDALVTIYMFHDFTCSASKRSVETMEKIKQLYPDQIRFVFFNNFDADSKAAMHRAKIALAAEKQGKFWEAYYHLFFMNFENNDEDLINIANMLELNLDQLKSDYASPEIAQQIARDLKQNERIGVNGSPNFMINNQFIHSSIDLNNLTKIIDQEILLANSQNGA